MKSVLIDLQYFPTIEYFCELLHAEEIFIEAHESYQKQTYRNRTKILAANKVIDLTIPVQQGKKHIPIRDVKIEYNQKWMNQHSRSIISAYGKAPFFEHYWDYLGAILEKEYKFLFDLNSEVLTTCLKLMGYSKEVKLTSSYEKDSISNTLDVRSVYSPKNKEMPNWQYSYYQLFGNKFVKGMSILDLLFCVGPETKNKLLQSERTKTF